MINYVIDYFCGHSSNHNYLVGIKCGKVKMWLYFSNFFEPKPNWSNKTLYTSF